MNETIDWLQSISFNIDERKEIIKLDFLTTTDDPINGEPDKTQTVYIPSLGFRNVLNALIAGGKNIEKATGLDLNLKDFVGDKNAE